MSINVENDKKRVMMLSNWKGMDNKNQTLPAELRGDPIAQSGYMGTVTMQNMNTVETPSALAWKPIQTSAPKKPIQTSVQKTAETVPAPNQVQSQSQKQNKPQIAYNDEGKKYTPFGEVSTMQNANLQGGYVYEPYEPYEAPTTAVRRAEDNDPSVVQHGRSAQGRTTATSGIEETKKILTPQYGEFGSHPDVLSGNHHQYISRMTDELKEGQAFSAGIWDGNPPPKQAEKRDDGSWLTAGTALQEGQWLTNGKVGALGEFAGTMDYMGDTYAQGIWNIATADATPTKEGSSNVYSKETMLTKGKLGKTANVTSAAKVAAKESLGIVDTAINAAELAEVGRIYGTNSKEFEQKLAATAVDVAIDMGAKVLAGAAGAAVLTIGMPAAVLAVTGITVAGAVLSLKSDDIAEAFMESDFEQTARNMVPLEMQYYQQVDELIKTYGEEAVLEAAKNMYVK